jgi:hypothetical protein
MRKEKRVNRLLRKGKRENGKEKRKKRKEAKREREEKEKELKGNIWKRKKV